MVSAFTVSWLVLGGVAVIREIVWFVGVVTVGVLSQEIMTFLRIIGRIFFHRIVDVDFGWVNFGSPLNLMLFICLI